MCHHPLGGAQLPLRVLQDNSLSHDEERKKLMEAGEKQAQALREAAPRQINPTRLLPAATALTPGAHFWPYLATSLTQGSHALSLIV